MAAIDPLTFFLWDQPRILVDIRPYRIFRKGSLENARSMPIDEYSSFKEFLNQEMISEPGDPVHFIDLDGKTAIQLSRLMNCDYLEGGYKHYKLWREKAFETGPQINIIGGYTGSGKTEFLAFLNQKGYQVIDLEELASHRGSVFGKIENKEQPLHEDFQNKLLRIWLTFKHDEPVWIEEKGPFLGQTGIPESLQKRMKNAHIYHLEVPIGERLKNVVKLYGNIDPEEFKTAIRKLESRMGMSKNHKTLHLYNSGQIEKCFALLIDYYDEGYDKRRNNDWKGKEICIHHNPADLAGTLKQIEKLK